MDKKGIFGITIYSVVALFAILALIGAFNYFNAGAASFSVTPSQLQVVNVPEKASSCIYSYKDSKPYLNFYTEDAAGTAVNPTWYLYTKNPDTISDYWGDERKWSDSSDEYWTSASASSGKAQKQVEAGTQVWAHASLSSYEDVFLAYTVPLCGDMTPGDVVDTNAGITVGTFTEWAWDTDKINSSTIGNFGATTTGTNSKKSVDITTRVAENKKLCFDQIKLLNLTKFSDASASVVLGEGLRKIQIVLPDGQTITPYDYSAGIDKTLYMGTAKLGGHTYDSDSYASDAAKIKAQCFTENQAPTVTIYAWLDTDASAQTNGAACGATEDIARMVIYNNEGSEILVDEYQLQC